MVRRLPLVFTPQPEGGFTVTSPVLPELVTEGDTLDEAFANVRDALSAVLELKQHPDRIALSDMHVLFSNYLASIEAVIGAVDRHLQTANPTEESHG